MTPSFTISALTLIGGGAFADVFRVDDSTVVKLFRRMAVTHDPIEDSLDHEIVLRAVWDAEATAFELVDSHPTLRRFLVPFHGRVQVGDVVDEQGITLREQYILDCGLKLSFVAGQDSKVGMIQDHPLFPRIDEFLDRLQDIGIRHPYDSSVFIPGLGEAFTVIDVAAWDAMAELTNALTLNGRLSDCARRQWRPPAA